MSRSQRDKGNRAERELVLAAQALLEANRRVDIYANDEWRAARRRLEDAIDSYCENRNG